MKKILALGLTVLSMNVFSQSYLILNNGTTLTTDKAGYVYDFSNFVMPYKVTLNGGSFFLEEDKLVTVNDQGFLYRPDFKVKKAKGKGSNYLLDDKLGLVTITSQGTYYTYDKDAAVKKIATFGGNFFTVVADSKRKIVDLYTVDSKGGYFKPTLAELNPAQINQIGGNYFTTERGTTFTVSKDGFVFPKTNLVAGVIVKKGGNFFVNSLGSLFTVSDDGLLLLPILPGNLVPANIVKLGANYMIDNAGKIFVVDSAGVISERTITEHDLLNTKVLSL